mmetsp:Transcript_320/g.305  ORF Transcript_320/g.305 Transcript_320/m.305 type:complete len:255 (-) Transcript_320:17-781(-)
MNLLSPFGILIVSSILTLSLAEKINGCTTVKSLDNFDILQYTSNKWYSHQQRENPFTTSAIFYCVSAEYSILDASKVPFEPLGINNGYGIKVFNKSQNKDGKKFTSDDSSAEDGTNVPSPLCAGQTDIEGDKASQLTVGFCAVPIVAFNPSNYWVLAYDENEGAALIAGGQTDTPNADGDGLCTYSSENDGLWIFSTSPVRNETLIEKYRGIARDNGIDPTMMKDVSHADCEHTPPSKKNQIWKRTKGWQESKG